MSVQYKVLGDLCDFQNGFAFKSKLFKDSGLPIIRITNIQDQIISTDKLVYFDPKNYKQDLKKYKVEPNDLLIAMSGATTGKIGFNNTNKIFYLNQRVGNLKPKQTLNKKYLYYFLLTQVEKNLKKALGSAQPNLSTEQIKNLLIPFPPLPIQQKIVAKLDKIFAEINNLESILQNKLSQVKMINNIIISSLVEKDKNLKKINLNNICDIKGRIGYRGYTKKDITAKGLGAISLSPSNIIDSKLDFKKVTYVSWKKYEESPEIMINPGDIVFCKTGSTYGKTAYVQYLPEKATLNPQLVTLKNIKCNKKYLFYYMMTEKFKFQIKEIVGGTAMPTLSQEKFGETIIELPPEDSQEVIVNKIDQSFKNVEKIFINTKIMIDNIYSLKSKVLQKNFMYE